ncbi:MAG: response regulator transcription factor [Candidatus Hydrogenedentes bacterium]|nr:response regulator transcription factor [Candidatus Hydrogenedentota bacterium]
MRILLADDHAIVRTGLRRIVADAFPDAVIGEAGSCSELLDKLREADWSVMILDIAMGGQNSLDLITEFKKLRPDLAIIVLSMYGERQFVIRALRLGVLAYLTKERAPEELLRAIQTVLRGERYIGESLAVQIADYMSLPGSGSGALHERLSAREHEVFLLLASAKSVTEIAELFSLSVKTVSTYRNRILEKMGLRSNAELMLYAVRNGLIT